MSRDGTLERTVRRLVGAGLLDAPAAERLGRLSRGELVSIRLELQLALWAGVTMAAGGAGLLVKDHVARLGPVAIAAGLSLAAAICFLYVGRVAAPFSWGRVPSPTLAFDYVLLLGVLLLGTDLAWVEAQFTVLGPAWPWHLLLVAILQFALALRYDSRAVLSIACASFAAWRGVAVTFPFDRFPGARDEAIRGNAVAVGAVLLLAGLLLGRTGRKAHFEPVLGNLGLALALGAAVTGLFVGRGAAEPLWWLLAGAAAPAAIVLGYRARRAGYFAQGVIAAYLGLLRAFAEVADPDVGWLFVVSASSLGVVALLVSVHRRWGSRP